MLPKASASHARRNGFGNVCFRRGLARTHRNIVIVALANKLARIAWATLRGRGSFDLGYRAATA